MFKTLHIAFIISLTLGISGPSFAANYLVYFNSMHVYHDDRVLVHVETFVHPTAPRATILGYTGNYCWLGHPSAPPSDRILDIAQHALATDSFSMVGIHASGSTCWINDIRIHQNHINPRNQ
jgi:hypothetical protein